MKNFQLHKLAIAICGVAAPLLATADHDIEEILVTGSAIESGAALDADSIKKRSAATSDTASLLKDIPGVNLYNAGGVSGLPVIRGLADDRLRIQVDGVDIISSCPNHMNSPLSYIDPTNVDAIEVFAGISPVSVGGDSIGGTISVYVADPKFAESSESNYFSGDVGTFYRSNGDARGANIDLAFATETFSMSYSGSTASASNYSAGGDFKSFEETGRPGETLALDEVGSSAYKSTNQSITLAFKTGIHLFETKLSMQDIPYELYPTQRMDMLNNEETRINLRYSGDMNWGKLGVQLYQSDVEHYMNFGDDRRLVYGTVTGTSGAVYTISGMPMYTEGTTTGGNIKASINVGYDDVVRVGLEQQSYTLDDWWPPSPDCGVGECMSGMAPNTFWNINNGTRDRLAVYGEWQAKLNDHWQTLAGLRVENVTTNADDVQGYNMGMMYAMSSVGTLQDWNNLDRERDDTNLDVTLLGRYTPNSNSSIEIGLAQKTRSPNLYERYTWAVSAMPMEMNNFVGDGNGYTGDPDLEPEVARTLSAKFAWTGSNEAYEFSAAPYYTIVDDYIDAIRRPDSMNMMGMSDNNTTLENAFVKLQYANQEAKIYGIDLAGRYLLNDGDTGRWELQGLVNYTQGENNETNDGLYNILPLNAKLSLNHLLGGLQSTLEVEGVAAKDDISQVRNELTTSGYSLVNLRTAYEWQSFTFSFGADNVLDRNYNLPLGGAYLGQGSTMSFNREAAMAGATGVNPSLWGIAVAGPGRSLYAGVNYVF